MFYKQRGLWWSWSGFLFLLGGGLWGQLREQFAQLNLLYRDGSILARVKLILTVIRLYLTRTESYEEAARANNNIHWTKMRFAIFRTCIRVDHQLQLVSSS